MISYLFGTVHSVDEKNLCLLVGGVGYEIHTPLQTLLSLQTGVSAEFFVYSHIREDQFSLFGFHSKEEKYVFQKLMDVSGIGPKGALGILSLHSPASLASAIAQNDVATLSHTPGIGKKTAEKIIIELRGKLDHLSHGSLSDSVLEVRLALEALGYHSKDVHDALSSLKDTTKSSQELIRECLTYLQK
jgi:Holliday junction DNA helicase RuvA